ncbi:hypothetical protein GY45DRAFT_1368960 [Cubamyces sp. BRFM 1775]|nr:hypothetical protein GY45DRAFT_1368960 [Cubamyces sp. BRFM 1775]
MAVPNFPIDEAYLVGSWLESFFWGIYTLLFAMTIRKIYQKRKGGINKFTTTCLILLYILASGHMALGLTRLIQGFVIYRDTIGTINYFSSIWYRVNMAKDYLYISNMFLGDLVVVWRLYIVWGKNIWYALIPFLMCISEFVVGYGAVSQWLLPHPNAIETVRWGTTMFTISMATNIFVTAVIAARIWYVSVRNQRAMGVEPNGRYNRVILLIVESGAIISATKLTEFTLFNIAPDDGIGGLNAMYILYEIVPQMTGIVPTMIIYAVLQGFTQKDDYYTGYKTTHTLTFAPRTEPAAQVNSTLSAVAFAPGDPDMRASKKTIAHHGQFEKLSLNLSRSSVPGDERV